MIYDALIIGGGPAGATAGWLLARSGWSVALLEKVPFPRRKVCGEFISATTLPLLRDLDIESAFLDMAGPPVRKVGIYAGKRMLVTPMPVNDDAGERWGRALGREHLDTLLLDGARQTGVDVKQPYAATKLAREEKEFVCRASTPDTSADIELRARIVIAAHGSWEPGPLPTQIPKRSLKPGDLFAFKAHFTQADLPAGMMPLLAFPGGYGGMVHTDHGRVSLSCCIRRDVLQRCRNHMHSRAAEATLAHIMEHCAGVRWALNEAHTEGAWLSAGPIRPGIRTLYTDSVFAAGNTAGEAHPVVAEGISMAMQGAWLLSEFLIANRAQLLRGETAETGHAYARAWYRHFAPRLRNAAFFAHLAMRPAATAMLLPLLQHIPGLLGLCTRFSGKTTKVINLSSPISGAL